MTHKPNLYGGRYIGEQFLPMPSPTGEPYGQRTLILRINISSPANANHKASPVTKYAESALKAQSHTHRWCPIRTLSCLISKLGEIDHILTVVSAEHVARYLTIRQDVRLIALRN
jgi:hypothetical protein